ncbi:MAG TPA: sigma-54-dependent Fis family transcriptional regulator [Cytophagales bacterium]|nr:sigma-54-dependent Fis family transcriptional regulator [Cytophagales bacterium]HRG09338.1 sigma-54 dependent transcriptional regulator [Cyclobacteriaceae bacterium]
MAVLLIEDDRTFQRILEGFLTKNKFESVACSTAKEGLAAVSKQDFDLVLLDYRLPDGTGMEVLEQIKHNHPQLPVIIMTSYSDIRTAVKAMKAGAFEYITKPVNPDELLLLIKSALSKPTKSEKTAAVSQPQFVVGSSDIARQLQQQISLVAPTNLSVIIQGESGTGKEQVARSIHQLSTRAQKPFVAVDCGALSKELAASELFGYAKGAFTGALRDKEGQFVAADGGTLFLDEVGNLSYEVQVKLLRAIQERIVQPLGTTKQIQVDVRIITATNDDLHEQSKHGMFREDLYYRLNEFKLHVPALRNRADDLHEFMEFFMNQANAELGRTTTGFSIELTNLFRKYDWPGNLREMKNVIKRAVLVTGTGEIGVAALPPEMVDAVNKPTLNSISETSTYDLKAIQESQERDLITKTLAEVRYNKSKAARLLNIDRKTLYLKMEKYNIQG